MAEWMPSEQLLQLAVKYATRARKRQLANRLTEMAEQLVRDREAEDTSLMEPTRTSYLSSSTSNHPLEDDRYLKQIYYFGIRSYFSKLVFIRDMFSSTPPVLEIEGKRNKMTKMDNSKLILFLFPCRQSDSASQTEENFCFWSAGGGGYYRRWQIHSAVESE